MKKKWFPVINFLILLVVALGCSSKVSADVIFEPEDSFYSNHSDQCVYVNRRYTVYGNANYKKSPDALLSSGALKAGTAVNILYIYQEESDHPWGYFEISDTAKKGWVSMGDLALTYDSQEFYREHQEALNLSADETLPQGTPVVFWSYPGSQSPSMDVYELPSELNISTTFTDQDGRLWGYVAYYYGEKEFWICISDPANKELPAFTYDNLPSTAVPEKGTRNTSPTLANLLTVFLPVLLLVVVCVLLIRKFWRKHPQGK